MDKTNIKEYRIIRTEMDHIKECITTYIGYVLGGSGAVFLALTASAKLLSFNCLLSVTIGVEGVILLVLYTLFYKFISHNRMAAYCRVLSEEHLKIGKQNETFPKNIFLWEVCINRIRDENKPHGIEHKSSTKAGICLLFKFLNPQKKYETKSWAFPLYVTTTFFLLSCSFTIFTFLTIFCICTDSPPLLWGIVGFLLKIGVSTLAWNYFFKKLEMVMEGAGTVTEFTQAFKTIRANCFQKIDQNIIPEYLYI